ncbi:hypothetical protein STAB1102_05370 [Streptococcus pyogenes STAB1102]|nr:hypothetical protein STAB1102_05370 [Streptococcus pyogenes STAB1102]
MTFLMVVSYTVLPHAQSRQTLRAWGFFYLSSSNSKSNSIIPSSLDVITLNFSLKSFQLDEILIIPGTL